MGCVHATGEGFLPRMVLIVLLVEAHDSTPALFFKNAVAKIAGEHVPHTEHKFEATVENDAQSNYGSSIQSYRHTTKQMYKGGRNPAFVKGVTQNDATGFQSKRGNVDVMVRVGCNDELAEPPTGAIDLVGSFNNQPRSTFALSRLSDSMSRSNFLHSWSFV
ncbi:hypothetical protein V6N11_006858 [Hibiscus sabdariffa]|uniref:Uncharacterized protein n=1 Tax=Hibiscus sabdariffa TaxID=183260 RepID=A0ABR2RSB5_9ROSI